MLTSREQQWIVSKYGDYDDPDARLDAWETLNDLVAESPDDAWRIILDICEQAPASVVEYLGCCQVEDLLARSAVEFRSRVMAAIRTNAGFRRALSLARYFAVPPEIVREIDAALQEAGSSSIRPDLWTNHPRNIL